MIFARKVRSNENAKSCDFGILFMGEGDYRARSDRPKADCVSDLIDRNVSKRLLKR